MWCLVVRIFINELPLWADQTGCLQFAPSFFKNRIAYGKKDLRRSMIHDKEVNTKNDVPDLRALLASSALGIQTREVKIYPKT